VSGIDWMNTPLEEFNVQHEMDEDGKTTGRMVFPHGEGEAQGLMGGLIDDVGGTYAGLLSEEDFGRFEETGEVPVMRQGARHYESIAALTLRDLPAVLDALTALEDERGQEAAEERERKATERKERERVRAKERRKLKKLGEW
jgi:hypothetical protein